MILISCRISFLYSLSYIHASEDYEQGETMASEINNIKADSRCEHQVNAGTFVEADIVQKTPNLDIFHVTLSPLAIAYC
jgi:hypothetical protein